MDDVHKEWCNQMGTVLEEMSSWTALTWHIVIKKNEQQIFWNLYYEDYKF